MMIQNFMLCLVEHENFITSGPDLGMQSLPLKSKYFLLCGKKIDIAKSLEKLHSIG